MYGRKKQGSTVKHVFFARVYFSRFSRFEFHSRKIHDRENFNVDYFYRFRPFFMYFGCFSGICCLLSPLLFAHSQKIHARKQFGWPFANNRCVRKIHVLQYICWQFLQNGPHIGAQMSYFSICRAYTQIYMFVLISMLLDS